MKLQRLGHRDSLQAWRPTDAEQQATVEKPGSSVGVLLRDSRQRGGEDLAAVAQALRIRRGYLEALEEGRFDDLPGATYAVGFVRTYAEHLGLDGEEVVRRFKAESSGISRSTALVFPSPVTEGGIPGAALLLVGALLAGLAYGGWYVLSTRDQAVAELVPKLPTRLAALVENARSSVGGTHVDIETPERAPAPAAPPSVDNPSPALPEPGPVVQAPSAPPSVGGIHPMPPPQPAPAAPAAAPPATTTPSPAATTAAPPVVAAPAPPPMPTPAQAAAESPVSIARAEAAPPPVPRLPATEPVRSQPPVAETRPPAVAAAPAIPPVPPAATGSGTPERQVAALPETTASPADSSISNTNAAGGDSPHIVVRARADSWIQVRDDVSNQLLLTRLMRAGDTYEVPNRAGLKLLTGNAGALEILVDGEMTPSLGPIGAVRRDISLNADLLRSGAAAHP